MAWELGNSFFFFFFGQFDIIMSTDKYSILLPTYNESENLPITIYLLVNALEKMYALKYLSLF